ncbi:MAG: hypothetical protein CBD18_01360 [Opitutales bacterium TMED158]|nr:MAG: hypothetical protein CBD18_01360 [Opitutales bacterium TMED158]
MILATIVLEKPPALESPSPFQRLQQWEALIPIPPLRSQEQKHRAENQLYVSTIFGPGFT